MENKLKKEWIKFIAVMILFMAGMVFLTIKGVHNWLFWLVYVAVWWWVETRIAQNIRLHWSIWILLIVALSTLDIWIIKTVTP